MIQMPRARVKQSDGTIETVVVPGQKPGKGERKISPAQDKNLLCSHCNTPVYFHAAAKVTAGSNRSGAGAHFQTGPRKQHEDGCPVPLRVYFKEAAEHKYDKTIGFRIHLNTLDEPFPDTEYQADPDFKKREPLSIKTMEDIKRLLSHRDLPRLLSSVVIFGEHIMTWPEFCPSLVDDQSGNAYEKLLSDLKSDMRRPVLMQVKIENKVWPRQGDRNVRGRAEPVFVRARGSKSELIVPTIYLNNAHNDSVRYALAETGLYLVMGIPSCSGTQERNGRIEHYVNIGVISPEQIAKADIHALRPVDPRP